MKKLFYNYKSCKRKEIGMADKLKGKTIAMLVTHGFEQSELAEPKKALEAEGAKVDIVSPESGKVKGWKDKNWADEFEVNVKLSDVDPNKYHGLVLPGGVVNPDRLRIEPKAIEFIKSFVQAKKPIAAICHGPWTLINAEGVRGKTMTSWPSLKLDLQNAGANWVDQEVVRDGLLVTSRKPADLPAFNKTTIEMFSEV